MQNLVVGTLKMLWVVARCKRFLPFFSFFPHDDILIFALEFDRCRIILKNLIMKIRYFLTIK